MGAVISTLHPFTRIILDYEFSYNLIEGKKRIDSLLSSVAFLGYSILVIYSAVLKPNKTTAKEPNLFSNFYMASVAHVLLCRMLSPKALSRPLLKWFHD